MHDELIARAERLAAHYRAEGRHELVASNVGDEITAEYARDCNDTADFLEDCIAALKANGQGEG